MWQQMNISIQRRTIKKEYISQLIRKNGICSFWIYLHHLPNPQYHLPHLNKWMNSLQPRYCRLTSAATSYTSSCMPSASLHTHSYDLSFLFQLPQMVLLQIGSERGVGRPCPCPSGRGLPKFIVILAPKVLHTSRVSISI